MATGTTINAIQSVPTPAGAVGDDCTIVTLWDAELNGNFLQEITISTNPDALVLNEIYEIAAGAIVLTQPVGVGETEEMARRGLRGRVSGGLWVQYHTGAAGVNGTANVITELGRSQATQTNFNIT